VEEGKQVKAGRGGGRHRRFATRFKLTERKFVINKMD
jgi:hypothetical protein